MSERIARYGDNKFCIGDLVAYSTLKSYTIKSIYNDDIECYTSYVFEDTGGLINLNGNGLILVKSVEEYTNQEMIDRVEKATSLLKNAAPSSVRDYNVGDSNYADFKIQPWDIWLEYGLNPWDADIVKRVLRDKESQSREMDYEKIIHICQERIRQIKKDID
jgi:hypothetical protein